MHHAAFGPFYGSGCPDTRRLRLRQRRTTLADGVHLPDRPPGGERHPDHGLPLRRQRLVAGQLRRDEHLLGTGLLLVEARRPASIQRLGARRRARTAALLGRLPRREQYRAGLAPGCGGTCSASTSTTAPRTTSSRQVSEFMQSAIPGDWECVAKAYQNREPSTTNAGLSKWANAAYVGDLSYDFAGLKEAVTRILAKAAYIPAPFAELTGYAYLDDGHPERGRLLPASALRRAPAGDGAHPLRQQRPLAARVRARPREGVPLLGLAPQGARALLLQLRLPHVRDAQPAGAAAGPDGLRPARRATSSTPRSSRSPPTRWTSSFPFGQWIDYWDESRVVSRDAVRASLCPSGGSRSSSVRARSSRWTCGTPRPATGRRQSSGSLTVLVYPSGTSSFRYREDARTSWITFTSTLADTQLTLTADPGLPEQPVLYRIGRWT